MASYSSFSKIKIFKGAAQLTVIVYQRAAKDGEKIESNVFLNQVLLSRTYRDTLTLDAR